MSQRGTVALANLLSVLDVQSKELFESSFQAFSLTHAKLFLFIAFPVMLVSSCSAPGDLVLTPSTTFRLRQGFAKAIYEIHETH